MSNTDLNALRAQVLKTQKNVGRKLARLRGKGVVFRGGEFDPRKDAKLVGRYTKPQLETHLRRLEKFQERSNQFVPGRRGVPIHKSSWDKYKQLERQYNKRIEVVRGNIGGLKLGDSTLTVGERFTKMVPNTGPSMGGGSMRYWPLERSSKGLENEKGIKKLIDDLQNKMRPNYQSEQEQRIRENFDLLLRYSGRDDLVDSANKLTPDEFAIMWNFSPTVQTLVENYYSILAMLNADEAALEVSGIEESYDEIQKIMDDLIKMGAKGGTPELNPSRHMPKMRAQMKQGVKRAKASKRKK